MSLIQAFKGTPRPRKPSCPFEVQGAALILGEPGSSRKHRKRARKCLAVCDTSLPHWSRGISHESTTPQGSIFRCSG
ncbi:hypothetical protein VTK26DRAFT_2161 [Humicola hyalothermophila]